MGPSRLVDLPVECFRALKQRIRGPVICICRAVLENDRGLDPQRVGFYLRQAGSRCQGECFIQASRDFIAVLIPFPVHARQADQRCRPAHRLVTRFLQGALCISARLFAIAGSQGQLCQQVQTSVQAGFVARAARHCLLEQPQFIRQGAMRLPVRSQGHAEVKRAGGLRILQRRNECLLQIWKLPLCDRVVGGGGLAGHLQEVGAMACPKLARVGVERLLGKFAQRVQHGEARDAGFVRLGVNQ